MDLEYSGNRSVEIVCFGLRGIMDIDGVTSTGNYTNRILRQKICEVDIVLTIENGSLIKIFAKLICIHGCTRNEEPEFRPKPSYILWNLLNLR